MYFIDCLIYNKIIKTIGVAPIESGGIIGIKNGVICAYYFDKKAVRRKSEYYPDIKRLNKVINGWSKKNITFAGIVHSHPNSCNQPSIKDKIYAENIIKNNTFLKVILFPIVTVSGDKIKLTLYEYTDDFYLAKYGLNSK